MKTFKTDRNSLAFLRNHLEVIFPGMARFLLLDDFIFENHFISKPVFEWFSVTGQRILSQVFQHSKPLMTNLTLYLLSQTF
jgi:hypothetical protein